MKVRLALPRCSLRLGLETVSPRVAAPSRNLCRQGKKYTKVRSGMTLIVTLTLLSVGCIVRVVTKVRVRATMHGYG